MIVSEKVGAVERRTRWQLTLSYVAGASLWIFFSDWQLVDFVARGSQRHYVFYQTAKGLLFVTVSGSLFFWFSGRLIDRLDKMRQRLQAREGAYQSLFDMNPLPCWIVDADMGSIQTVNQATLYHTGFSREELESKNKKDLLNPLPREEWPFGPESVSSICTLRTKSGELRYVEMFSLLLDQNPPFTECLFYNDVTDKLSAQRLIVQSEFRYRGLVEQASDGIAVVDDHENIVEANSQLCSMLGYTREELFRMKYKAILSPENLARFPLVYNSLQKGQIARLEREYRRKDGSVFPVELSLNRIEQHQIQVIIRDITERKKTETALRESEERLDLATTAANLALWDWFIPTGHVVINARWAQLLDHTIEEIEPHFRAFIDRIHPEDKKRVLQTLEAHLKGKTPLYQSEHRLRKKNGSWIWVLDTGRVVDRFSDGSPRRAAGSFLDITPQKNTEARLRATAIQYQALSELLLSYGMVFRFSASGSIVREWTTESMAKIIGYDLNEFSRFDLESVLYPEDRENVLAYRNTLSQGHKASAEFRIRCKDGSLRWIRAVAVPEWDNQRQKIIRFHEAGQDVTAQKKLEMELIDAKEKAEEMSRLKNAFLSNMSHEIRTPLTSVIGFAELLTEEMTGVGQEYASLIHKSGQRLMETLNSVLDLAQIQSGGKHLSPVHYNLADELNEVLQMFSPRAVDNGLTLHFINHSGAEVPVFLDKNATSRIVGNLISNAIKFTQLGSITIELVTRAAEVEISVRDTGIGITSEFLPHLFDEFKQESTGLTRDYEGSGLGLTITKHLIDLMRGDITVESEKGKGSLFTVRLPRYAQNPSEQSGIVTSGNLP